jgi:hypothetical protein
MSYCELLGFKKGGFESINKYRNSHGFCSFVWSCLFKKYIPKQSEYDSWLTGDDQRLWDLQNDNRLQPFERFVLRSTFDFALVKNEDIKLYIDCMTQFLEKYKPSEDRVCHIEAIIRDLGELGDNYIAVGWYTMSVGDNEWIEREVCKHCGNCTNDEIYYDVFTGDKHFFVHSDIESDSEKA